MAKPTIHPTAVITDGATIGDDVVIGPYCIVGPNVVLAPEVVLHSHVVVEGHTEIAQASQVYPFSSIGHPPQDKKYKGEKSRLIIGARTIIREHVTMNPGTEGGGMITKVGDDCLFMASTHVAHDCIIGNHVIFAFNAAVAGHVSIGDYAIIGGMAAVHQFVRIGAYAFIGGMAGVQRDVIPFGTVKGERALLDGLNLVGLKRRNVDREHIHALRKVFKELFHGTSGTLAERAEKLRATYTEAEAAQLLDFILADTSRAFCSPEREESEVA
jgi:UDP-N-acetylglucosamine acyltransferase